MRPTGDPPLVGGKHPVQEDAARVTTTRSVQASRLLVIMSSAAASGLQLCRSIPVRVCAALDSGASTAGRPPSSFTPHRQRPVRNHEADGMLYSYTSSSTLAATH